MPLGGHLFGLQLAAGSSAGSLEHLARPAAGADHDDNNDMSRPTSSRATCRLVSWPAGRPAEATTSSMSAGRINRRAQIKAAGAAQGPSGGQNNGNLSRPLGADYLFECSDTFGLIIYMRIFVLSAATCSRSGQTDHLLPGRRPHTWPPARESPPPSGGGWPDAKSSSGLGCVVSILAKCSNWSAFRSTASAGWLPSVGKNVEGLAPSSASPPPEDPMLFPFLLEPPNVR